MIGPYTATPAAVLASLTVPTPANAIMDIQIAAGQTSSSNNFSVVETQVIYLIQPLPPAPPPAVAASFAAQYQPVVIAVNQLPQLAAPTIYTGSSQVLDYSWHLSVVNAGQPRSTMSSDDLVTLTAAQAEELAWQSGMEDSEWTLAAKVKGKNAEAARRLLFGMKGGTPVSGDFNGDGMTDVGVFRDGQWFIDLNGNGVWDEGDLWAKLGYRGDKPVTGDWDGDGKDDIGIFGRAWAGDPRHIAREPGLPDSSTSITAAQKNVPPPQSQATMGKRAMKRTRTGHLRRPDRPRLPLRHARATSRWSGDWNGDGIDTIGVFRDGWWYLDVDGDGKWSDTAMTRAQFGQRGRHPGGRRFQRRRRRRSGASIRNGTWYIDTNGNRVIDGQRSGGEARRRGDVPVVGDWDGDGHEEIGTYRDGEIVKSTARRN